MLVVETIAKIRRAYFAQQKPIKAICREFRVSRKVVRKVIRSEATEFRYGLIANCPVDSLSRLAQSGRALDEQAPDVLSVFALEPPEEKPLDDLAQPLLGVLCREEGGGGCWRGCVQDGPAVARVAAKSSARSP
jgi:hypothetical protein